METIILHIIFIFVLFLFSAFFSGSETALFSLKRSDLLRLANSTSRRDKKIAALMTSPQKILITILTGNLIVNILIPSLTTKLLLKFFSTSAHLIVIACVTPLLIIFSEITPKVIAVNIAETFSRNTITLLGFFHVLLSPLRIFFSSVTNIFIKVFNLNIAHESSITEEELDMAVTLSESEGVIGRAESDFIKNVLRFSKKAAENVMIPRNEAIALQYGATIKEAIEMFKISKIVRAPVYKKNMDHIVGFIDSRDLIPYQLGFKKARNINKLLHTIQYYPSSKELDQLLTDFLQKKIQVAVVIDEYGGTAGIVTLSSIISEVMGYNFALTEEGRKREIKKLDELTSIVSGDMQIDDFNYQFNDEIDSSEAETIGGYIIEKIGHFPKRGEEIHTLKHNIRIRNIKKNRIDSIEVSLLGDEGLL